MNLDYSSCILKASWNSLLYSGTFCLDLFGVGYLWLHITAMISAEAFLPKIDLCAHEPSMPGLTKRMLKAFNLHLRGTALGNK